MSSSRNFILTLNEKCLEFYADILYYIKSLVGVNYILVTEHVGQENKHYHMYIQFKNSKRLSIKKLHGAHVEKCFGSAQKNIEYLKCEDNKHKSEGVRAIMVYEEGTPVSKGGYSVASLLEVEKREDLQDSRLFKIWRDLKKTESKSVKDFFKLNVQVKWIQGPSGAGKTRKAVELALDYEEKNSTFTDFIKHENGFYSGITDDAKVAIYDDFRDSHMKPSEFINLVDYYKHWMNVKGDNLLNNYELIIITSVQKLNDIYSNMRDVEPKKQWERRIEVINMYPPELVHIGGMPIGYTTNFNQLENYEVLDTSDNTHVIIN